MRGPVQELLTRMRNWENNESVSKQVLCQPLVVTHTMAYGPPRSLPTVHISADPATGSL